MTTSADLVAQCEMWTTDPSLVPAAQVIDLVLDARGLGADPGVTDRWLTVLASRSLLSTDEAAELLTDLRDAFEPEG